MQIDGKQIQNELKQDISRRVAKLDQTPRIDLFYAGSNSVIETFMHLKKQFGEAIGARVVMHTFASHSDADKLTKSMQTVAGSSAVDGIVIQLPLPSGFATQDMLDMIPKNKDVDVLASASRQRFRAGGGSVLPPVVGAVEEVCDRHDVDLAAADTAVVGAGRLVGQPMAVWLENNFGPPKVFEQDDDLSQMKEFDVVISGAGDPHVITPDFITDGVVLLDAGTSQSEGGTKGDIDPACAKKARLYSPVPGGIGPITVAKLFANLVILTANS